MVWDNSALTLNPSEINWSPVFANNEFSVIRRRTSL